MNSFENLALSESGFLFDAVNGNTYTLNTTGRLILRELISGADQESIIGRVVKKFDVTPETARRDTERFFQQLKEMKIVPRDNGEQEGR